MFRRKQMSPQEEMKRQLHAVAQNVIADGYDVYLFEGDDRRLPYMHTIGLPVIGIPDILVVGYIRDQLIDTFLDLHHTWLVGRSDGGLVPHVPGSPQMALVPCSSKAAHAMNVGAIVTAGLRPNLSLIHI